MGAFTAPVGPGVASLGVPALGSRLPRSLGDPGGLTPSALLLPSRRQWQQVSHSV